MPTVSELKVEARELEQAGAIAEALMVYDDLLARAERAEETVSTLAGLYQHVGDLRVLVRQPSRAFACYQKAADLHAVTGAAPAILELCVKMINVVPAAGDTYLRFARRLLDHNHPNATLSLLSEYARRAGIVAITEAVDGVRSGSHGREDMEGLCDTLDAIPQGPAAAARSVIEELERSVDMVNVAEAPVPTGALRHQAQDSKSAVTRTSGRHVTPSGQVSRSEKKTPRAKPSVLLAPRSPSPRSSRMRLIGAVITIAAIFLVVIILKVQLGAGAVDSPTVAPVADAGPSVAEDLVSEGEVSADEGVSATATEPPPTTTASTTSSPSTQAPTTPPQPQAAIAASDGDSVLAIDQPIVVGDLVIRTVSPATFRGQQGFRVVHVLDSVAELVVESYPVDSASARSFPLGTIIVNVVQPDTSVSIVRFDERYIVFASGVLPEDSMRTLLGMLQIRGQ